MEVLNLIIDKVYSPDRIIKEIEKFGINSRIEIGHAVIADNKGTIKPYHDYHLNLSKLRDLVELRKTKEKELSQKSKEKVTKVKQKKTKEKEIPLEIHVKILRITNPCKENFAYKLLMSDEIQEYLEKIKKSKQAFLIEEQDLKKHECKSGMNNATKCLNCVMSKNDLEEFRATPYTDRNDKRRYIKISYHGIVKKEEIECDEK